jgi:hypothetical protein
LLRFARNDAALFYDDGEAITEERHDGRIEFLVKSDAVEARCIYAQLGPLRRQRRRTRRQEGEVPSVRRYAILVLGPQALIYRGDVMRQYAVPAAL